MTGEREHKAASRVPEGFGQKHVDPDLISSYADGETIPVDLAHHLEQCDECRCLLQRYRKVGMMLAGHFHHAKARRSEACPSDEDLAAYLDGSLEPAARSEMETHIRECDWCLGELAELKRLIDRTGEAAPERCAGPHVGFPFFAAIGALTGVIFSPGATYPWASKEKAEMGNITCAACGTVNPPGSRFCRECGVALSSGGYDCLHCGAKIEEGSKFCTQCGRAVVAQAPPKGDLREAVEAWLPQSARENKWLVGAIAAILASFAFPAIFLQFLLAAGIMGGAWLLDKAKREMLADLYRAWKSGDEAERDRLLARLKEMVRKR